MTRGSQFVWSLHFNLFGIGGPYWECKTPANVALGVIKACKLPQGLIHLLAQQEMMMMMMACKITKTPFR